MVFVEENKTKMKDDADTNLNLKIIDFGGAMKMKYKINKENRKVGTVSYMSPETFEGIYSEKVDVWSCGVVLYVLLSGKLPFSGTSYEKKKDGIKNLEPCFKGTKVLSQVNNGKRFLFQRSN